MSPRAGLPAFQFYPGDWRKDPGIQALDYESRGVWFEMLLLMHESEDRGKLMLNGKAMPDKALSQILGLSEAETKQIVSKLEAYGVASRDPETGALMNRRMVRDEATRRARAEAGRKGGLKSRPPKAAHSMRSTGKANEKQNRTSSSSSSSSDETPPGWSDQEWAVFGYWRDRREQVLGRSSGPRIQPIKKRRFRIRARLAEGYTPDQLERAVDGCLSTDFNIRNGHTDIELICRDQQHVEQYLARADNVAPSSGPPDRGRL